MADARASGSQAPVGRAVQKPLSQGQINTLLFEEDDEFDFDDPNIDRDITQGSDGSDTDTGEDDTVSVYRSGRAGRHRSSPLPVLSPPPPPPSPIFDESDTVESFSGFSDAASDTSSIDEPSASSCRGGVTRRRSAVSAGRPAKRRHVSPHDETDDSVASTSTSRPTSRQGRRPATPSQRRLSARKRTRSGVSRGGATRRTGEFVWEDCDIFVPQKPQFDHSDVGVTPTFPYTGDDMTEMDYFLAYFDEQFMQHLVAETNRYAGQLVEGGILQASRMIRWKDTTVAELYVFFALCMLMKHSEKHVIQDYWNKECAVPTPVFNKYMSRDRFLILLRCLHFENIENVDRNDRLWRVRKVFSDMRGKFRDYFAPGQNVVIDESLVLFKGRVLFKQYIPSKRHRFGLKFFVLCDCETGMVIDMILYSGTDVDIPAQDPHGFSGSVVKTLMEPLLNKGHILYTDNYYTSPLLTKFLLEHNTGVCGTVKAHRKEMPFFGTNIGVGDCELRKCDKILAVRWKDRREVNMLSTIHTGEMLDSGKVRYRGDGTLYKPDCIIDYNINMRLVDKCDMMVGAVECVRKSVKWTRKFFFHLLDVTVLNCFNMFLVKTGKKPSIRVFSHAVVSQLLVKYGQEDSVRTVFHAPTRPHLVCNRLAGKDVFAIHKPAYLPPTGTKAKGVRECIVCKNSERKPRKRKCVCTICVECKVPLCLMDCFFEYHSLAKY